MKHSNQIAYIRQLSSLGLPKEVVLPPMVAALSPMVPAYFGSLLELDKQGQPLGPVGYYSRQDSLFRGLDFSQSTRDHEFLEKLKHWFSHTPVLSDLQQLDRDFYQSRVYHEFLKPSDIRYLLMALVPQRQGLPLLMHLSRRSDEKPFGSGEVQIFNQLLPYFEQAVKAIATDRPLLYARRGEQAMIVVEIDGSIRFASESARRLLFLASFSELDTHKHRKLWLSEKLRLPDPLMKLCHDLHQAHATTDTPTSELAMANGYGEFQFEANWLETYQQPESGLIGINIYYRQPALLSWLNALKNTSLSPMQREVALLLAQGKSQEQVATGLNLKVSSVKDYTKKIYSKLNVTRREEFLSWLTDAACP